MPQGQGHRTVLAQVVADVLGLAPKDIRVDRRDRHREDAWSIASGNYSSRFAAAVCGAVHLAATQLKDKLARSAAAQLNVPADEIEFAGGKVGARGNPDNAMPFGRLAAASHWSPGIAARRRARRCARPRSGRRRSSTAPTRADETNSSLCHGFVFDFCGVEIDRDHRRGADRPLRHHARLRPRAASRHGRRARSAAASRMRSAPRCTRSSPTRDDGAFLSGTFADYLVPTATEVPEPVILHVETPSPFTPLGAKGVGEGNCMSTPVCIANAVADALGVATHRPAADAEAARCR